LIRYFKATFPNPKKHRTGRRIITEAAALIYYHATLIIYLAPHGVWNGWAQFPQAEGLQKTQILAWAGEALRLRRVTFRFN